MARFAGSPTHKPGERKRVGAYLAAQLHADIIFCKADPLDALFAFRPLYRPAYFAGVCVCAAVLFADCRERGFSAFI